MATKPTVIGLCGEAKTGKSTMAEFLTTLGYTELSFATPIKQIGEIFFFTPEQLYGSQEEKAMLHPYWGFSARDFLQRVGTELFRETLPKFFPNLGEDVWIKHMEYRISRLSSDKYVISDVRHPNEAKFIREKGGILIKCLRNTDVSDKHRNHLSEVNVNKIDCDLIVDNDKLNVQQARELVFKF